MSGIVDVCQIQLLETIAHLDRAIQFTFYVLRSHDDDDYASYCYGFVYGVMIYMVGLWHLLDCKVHPMDILAILDYLLN